MKNRENGISNIRRDGTMQKLGILLYGYGKDHADMIRKSLEEVLDNPLTVFSGTNNEDSKLMDILSKGPEGIFEEKDVKILVFLGFDNAQIASSLGGFPGKDTPNGVSNLSSGDFTSNEELVRPIFCGLTGENVNWPLSDLIEHLLEEDRHFKGKEDTESP